MAKIELNPMFDGVHGKLNRIVYKKFRGKTIMGPMPAHSDELSEAQQAHQERFALAAQYGSFALADPETRKPYVAVGKELDQNPMALCIADYFYAPEVIKVDSQNFNGQPGSTIAIETKDDFGVVKVEVCITNADEGDLFEQGMATEVIPGKGVWTYTTTQPIPAGILVGMEVKAFDRPGNEGMQIATKQF
jgi:hypothetical protein